MKGFTFWARPSMVTLEVEREPFTSRRIPLEGTDFHFQVAISDATANREMVAVRDHCEAGLQSSGDERSGALLLSGDDVIGSLLVSRGRLAQEETRLVIHPDFRGDRLGQRLTTEWHKHSARFVNRGVEKLNLASIEPHIDAHLATCRWAAEQGLPVPDRVLEELETGFEEMVLRGLLEGVQRTGKLVVVSASKLPPPGVNDGNEARAQLARSPAQPKPQ